MKTELRCLLLIVIFTFGFCLSPNSETNGVSLDNNCYFKPNQSTELYDVRENNTLTNEISIKNQNTVEFYQKGYSIPKKVEEKKEEIKIEDSQETVNEEDNNQPQVVEQTQPAAPVQQQVVQVADANSDLANSIINYALQFVGNPYVYGGTSLTSGTDCSGFTQSVFANFGISLPRTAPAQGSVGNYVPLDNIQAGDLVLYGYNGSITHVALYIGNGQVVHALNPSQGIAVTAYNLEPIMTVRRVL